jgi:NTE family protein
MNAMAPVPATLAQATPAPAKERAIREQVVLVLQGGGALGAYQAGVYQGSWKAASSPTG